MASKKKIEEIRKEVLNWIWWEEDHDESEPLLWAVAEEIVRMREELKNMREIADDLYNQLKTYACHCNLSKCKCGHDSILREYESTVSND